MNVFLCLKIITSKVLLLFIKETVFQPYNHIEFVLINAVSF